MRILYLKLCVFTLPLLVLAMSVEWLYRALPNIYAEKGAYLEQRSHNTEVLILGNSHTLFGLNPAFFEKSAYNAANLSQSLAYDLFLLEQYGRYLENLQIIIVPISYFSLDFELEKSLEAIRKYHYIRYYGYPAAFADIWTPEYYSAFLASNRKKALIDIIDYYVRHTYQSRWSDAGWGTGYSDEKGQDLDLSGTLAAERHDAITGGYARNLKRLDAMLEICAHRAIRVCFLTPPAWIAYRRHLNAAKLQRVVTFMDAVAHRNPHVRYLNLIDDARFLKTDFYDADHLNHSGAQKLSRILNRELANF